MHREGDFTSKAKEVKKCVCYSPLVLQIRKENQGTDWLHLCLRVERMSVSCSHASSWTNNLFIVSLWQKSKSVCSWPGSVLFHNALSLLLRTGCALR